jgi:predicted N-acetyltransferase YhbS
VIRRIAETDDPSRFSCGSAPLDHYLAVHALANSDRGIGIAYVHVDEVDAIDGYITLACTSISAGAMPASHDLPRFPLPALLVARLAVDTRVQGRGVGSGLLRFALEEALAVKARTGCVAVVVDAKPEAASFYARFGFESVDRPEAGGDTIRMALGGGAILDALD